jgi:hypothetical protein
MTLRYRTETTLYVAQSLLRTWAGTNGIGVRKVVPSPSLAEDAKRFGLLQVHSFRLQKFWVSLKMKLGPIGCRFISLCAGLAIGRKILTRRRSFGSVSLAATNKCLARSNKSHTGVRRLTSHLQRGAFLWRCQSAEPRCGVLSAAGLSLPFGGARRAEAEHELAPSRAVFSPLSACSSRGVPGYHLRVHPEIQAETAGSPAARRAPA